MVFYIRARFRIAMIGGNLTGQSTGSLRGIGGGIQIPERDVVASSRRRQTAPSQSLLPPHRQG